MGFNFRACLGDTIFTLFDTEIDILQFSGSVFWVHS